MTHLAPIPCAHCGTNFMRRSIDPDAPKLCNNCEVKELNKKQSKGETKMESVKLLIECPRKSQIEIEEHCTRQGLSISTYLIGLHDAHMQFVSELDVEEPKAPTHTPQRKTRGGKK